jgi:hypothetical protein
MMRISRFVSVIGPAAVFGLLALDRGGAAYGQPAGPAGSAGSSSAQDASALKAWRKPFKERRRRIIFNNDGNEPIRSMTGPNAQELLDARTSALVGTHVDTIFYCTAGPFGTFNHLTRLGQVFTCKEPPYETNRMDELVAAGLDPLEVMVEFCRKRRIEVFWSLRMNDVHDHGPSGYGPVRFRFNKLKTEHPEYLLGSPEKRSRYGAWSGVNYGRPEVRDLAFRYLEEVCQRYDVDGVELDFFRHPVFFRATLDGKPVGDDERDQMTELLRRVRRMADERGRQRGRPILIAMRVPDSVAYARAIGLDIEQWLTDDLLDLLVVGSYFQLNEWEYSVALGHRYGVPVYPSLDESRVKDEAAARMRSSLPAFRGRADRVWASGADGIYMFNFFDPRDPLWKELGDPALLAGLDRDYFASVRGAVGANGGNLPFAGHQKIETLCPGSPKTLTPGGQATARLNAGRGFQGQGTAPVSLRLRLRFDPPPAPETVGVTINQRPLTVEPDQQGWLKGALQPADVRAGLNDVRVTLAPAGRAGTRWQDAVIEARYE